MPTVRVATVNYGQKKLESWEEFVDGMSYWVGLAADAGSDFVCFPEYLTLQLLSLDGTRAIGRKAVEKLAEFTARFYELMTRLARDNNIHIVAGSHLILDDDGHCRNVSSFFSRDGQRHDRAKIHATPNERRVWDVKGGDKADVISTDVAKVGIMVCYDSEFPEMARHLVEQGADIIFVPFCTDDRQGYLRVRYSSAARAIENQCYMVLSGNVGHLLGVHNMDAQYGQSAVLTPCDYGFPRDGIAVESSLNLPEIVITDLRMDDLQKAKRAGSVRNWDDRRLDLYNVTWRS